MHPHSIRCAGCSTSLRVARCLALYAIDYDAARHRVREDDLLWMPVKVVWCGACNAPTLAEDLRPLSTWEATFAAMQSGKPVEFPYDTTFVDDKRSELGRARRLFDAIGHRTDPGRCVFCGGFQYIALDSPHLRHDGCGGRFEVVHLIGSSLHARSAYKAYATDGMLIGQLDEVEPPEGFEAIREHGYDALPRPELLDTYIPGSAISQDA